MVELIAPFILGVVLGTAAGLIPSVSPGRALMLIAAFTIYFNPLQLMVLYISLLTVSQYVDAIPSIYLGIPGASSSIPAATESQGLRQRGLCDDAIRLTAISRLLGTLIAVTITAPIIVLMISATWIYSVKFISVILLIALVGVAMTGRDRWPLTLIMMLCGGLLGLIGYNPVLNSEILTWESDVLYNGIPLICVMLGLYVTPRVIFFVIPKGAFDQSATTASSDTWSSMWPTTWRSSLLGTATGLVPGASYILSSTVCYTRTKQLRLRQGMYHSGDIHCVVASETGNTAGAFASLLPLLLFGIPITLSESVVYDMMVSQGADFSQGNFIVQHWPTLCAIFLSASAIAFIICWPMARPLLRMLISVPTVALQISLFVTIITSIILVGHQHGNVVFYLVCWIMLSLVGWSLRKIDCLPLIFTFILMPHIEKNTMTLIQLFV